ncbi:MAG: hypothetical protein VW146_00880 [Gammaproteobacteria bacterium]
MSLFFPLSLLFSGIAYTFWDRLPLVSQLSEYLRFIAILFVNTVFFILLHSEKDFFHQTHLLLSLSGAILLLLTIIKGIKLETRIKRVKSGKLSLSSDESIEMAYSNIINIGGAGLILLMLAVLSGMLLIDIQPTNLVLKSFFAILAVVIYLGILSLIKFNNLKLKNAVRMLLLSFIMILVSYSLSNAAISLS